MDEQKGMNNGGSGANGGNGSGGASDADFMQNVITGLSGSSIQKIDSKGRFTFPKKLRVMFGDEQDSVVITKGARFEQNSLWAMPKSEWARFEEKINRLPETNDKMDLSMWFIGGKEVFDIDNFGRILLSPVLRDHVGAESGELSVTGIGRRIVIMDRKWYEQYFRQEGLKKRIDSGVDKYGL